MTNLIRRYSGTLSHDDETYQFQRGCAEKQPRWLCSKVVVVSCTIVEGVQTENTDEVDRSHGSWKWIGIFITHDMYYKKVRVHCGGQEIKNLSHTETRKVVVREIVGETNKDFFFSKIKYEFSAPRTPIVLDRFSPI